MKKMILVLAVTLFTLSSFASDENVNQKVLDAFKTEFSVAKEVSWTAENGYYKAAFNYNGKYVFAYYSEEGDFLGLTRYLSPTDLPIMLQNSLKKNYEGYWISDLFEASKGEGTSYYVTIENADSKIILKSVDNSWNQFSKVKKI